MKWKTFVKWAPILVTLVMGLAFVFALNGQYEYLEHLSGKFGCALLILPFYMWESSNRYRFCYWHKAFIVNVALVSLAANLKVDFGLMETYLNYCRIVLLITILGLVVSAVLYLKYGCFKSNFKSVTK